MATSGECTDDAPRAVSGSRAPPSCDSDAQTSGSPQRRLVLVTGCARSGSGYIAAVLQACGLDVRQEAIGRDGCASWTMAVESKRTPWGPARDGTTEFEHVFHQVRHPLSVISSVWTTEGPRSWGFIAEHVPKLRADDSIEVRCVKYWYYWNRAASRVAEFTYRLEDLANAWPELCRRLGRKLDARPLSTVPTDINARRTKPPSRGNNVLEHDFTWAELRRLVKPRLFGKLCKLAESYGYSCAQPAPSPRPPPAPPSACHESKGLAPVKRLLLVTGCARSGTAYTAAVLKACGVAVEHEFMGADGCVSWPMAVRAAQAPWGPAFDGATAFEHVFHQVRHPLAVISSVWSTEGQPSWDFIYAHTSRITSADAIEVRCAKYWYYWNRRAGRLAEWTYRVEELPEVWDELCTRLGRKLDASHLATVSARTNSRDTKPMSRGVEARTRDFT